MHTITLMRKKTEQKLTGMSWGSEAHTVFYVSNASLEMALRISLQPAD